MSENVFLHIYTQTQRHTSPFTEQKNEENTKMKRKILRKKKLKIKEQC